MTDHSASISVIVPVCDDVDALERTLPRLEEAAAAHGSAEVILVDNGSEDGSYELMLKHRSPGVRVLEAEESLPIGAVRNLGAREAAGEVLCFVDADVLFTREHLIRIEEVLDETGASAVGALCDIPSDAAWVERTWHLLHRNRRSGYVRSLGGGNLAVRKQAFFDVGGFDTDLVTGEDAELCQRLRRNGYDIFEDPSLRAVHLGNATTVQDLFRKERWYALGMFGTVTRDSIDRPVVMTFAHLAVVLAALLTPLVSEIGIWTMGATVGAGVLVVPAASVGYRWIQQGRVVRPVRALLLYEVFYLARVTALVLILTGQTRGWRA